MKIDFKIDVCGPAVKADIMVNNIKVGQILKQTKKIRQKPYNLHIATENLRKALDPIHGAVAIWGKVGNFGSLGGAIQAALTVIL